MNCDDYRILISALIDKEATASEESSLREHLSSCTACERTYREMAGVRAALAAWQEEGTVLEPRYRRRSDWLSDAWTFLFRGRLSVPVPIAFSILLILFALALITLRQASPSAHTRPADDLSSYPRLTVRALGDRHDLIMLGREYSTFQPEGPWKQ